MQMTHVLLHLPGRLVVSHLSYFTFLYLIPKRVHRRRVEAAAVYATVVKEFFLFGLLWLRLSP